MEGYEVGRVLVRGSNGKKDGCGTIYMKEVTEVLRKQVEFCEKDYI